MSYGYDDPGYRSAEPYQGISLRMLAGLVLAIISVILYMTKTQVNPVTGCRQHIAMTVDQEEADGPGGRAEMARQMGGRVDPTSDRRSAREVADRIGRRSSSG